MTTQTPKGATPRRAGRPRAEAQGIGRDTLLELTCSLLKTTHHRHITASSVARMAGVDPSLIRYYFNSREDLIFAAAEQLTVEFRRLFNEALTGTDNTPEGELCARVHALVEISATYPFYSRLIGEEVMHADSELARSIFGSLMDRGIATLAPVVERGISGGRFRAVDPTFLFSTMVGMGEFFLHTKRRAQVSTYTDADLATLKDRYKAFVCDLLLAGIMVENKGLGHFRAAAHRSRPDHEHAD